MARFPSLFRLIRRVRGAAPALLVLLAAGLLAACSGPIGKAYHNLAGRDNGYFLARQQVREVEKTLVLGMVNDYNKTLRVLPPLSEATAQAVATDLEDIVKKASLPLTRHKNSNWADDAYLVVGQARYFKTDYDEAAKVFKYVNTTGKEPNVRHAALVWLMRTFIALNELDNAVAVSDLLNKEKGTPGNARDLFLTRAQLHILRDEPAAAIVNLRLAIPEIRGKNERSRIRFILGQLYQETNQDALAYDQYHRILRRNPPYELDLFAKLRLSQVTQVKDEHQRARVDKYFARLVKDFKNQEYRDRIYYEMARLEYRQQHYKKALELLGKSAKASTGGPQKPYTYLLGARIAYENLENYRLAQRYYDSTAKVLPPTAKEFPLVQDRAEVLNAFVKQLDIVEGQDSLQAVARLDSGARNALIETMVTAELNRRAAQAKKEAAVAEALERAGPAPVNGAAGAFPGGPGGGAGSGPGGNPFGAANNTGLNIGAAASGAVWYFDNPGALATARADFTRRWGNRALSDNWRVAGLSQRNPGGSGAGGADKTGGLAAGAKGDSAAGRAAAERSPEQLRAAAAAQLRVELLKDLPKTPADFKASDDLIEEALFKLARIYDARLHEPVFATERYEELLNRFPQTLHAPEALYALYLLAKNAQDDGARTKWANALRTRFPKTEYAQLIDDPLFHEKVKLANARARVMYDSAYAIYRDGLYPKAGRAITLIRTKFPVNEISDKLALLDALIIGHTAPTVAYRAALTQFKTDYPTSPLLPRADELLATIGAYESGELNRARPDATATASTSAGAAPVAAPVVVYATNKSARHYVMIVYPQNAPAFASIETKYSDYNRLNHAADNLRTSSLLFGETNQLLLVKEFEDARAAQTYARRQNRRAPSPLAAVPYGTPYEVLVISADNLPRFYQAKDLEGYQAFAKELYGQ